MGCCNDELTHCHGVLIRHDDGRTECAEDPVCDAGEPTHVWAVGCTEVGCRCWEHLEDRGDPVRLAA